jgi:hypothetical protein
LGAAGKSRDRNILFLQTPGTPPSLMPHCH